MSEPSLAYLMTEASPDRSAYIGAVMVTDRRGLPTEFRYTQPIRPSKIQRVLYGGALEWYLRADVIGACLLREIQSAPAAVIVREEVLLPLEEHVACPVLHLFPTNQEPLGDLGADKALDDRTFLIQLQPGAGPTRVRVGRSDASLCSAARDILAGWAESSDVYEPLGRLEEALELLWTETQDSSNG